MGQGQGEGTTRMVRAINIGEEDTRTGQEDRIL